MRILIAAPTQLGTAKVGLNFGEGLRALGHEIRYFDYDRRPAWLSAMPKALRGSWWEAAYLAAVNETLLDMAKAFRPDMFLCVKGLQLHPETIREIGRSGAVTVGYWIDDPLDHQRSLKNAAAYNLYLTNDRGSVPTYHAEGVTQARYMPSAADPELFHPLNGVEKTTGISFIGTRSELRESILFALQDLSPVIYGPGWQKRSKIAKQLLRPETFGDGINRVFNESRINLNIHNWFGVGTAMNLRLFEVPAARGFLLTDWVAEIDEQFEEDRHVVCWRSVEELRDKACYYLERESECNRIALAGYQHVLSKHTYLQRAHALIALL